MEKFRIETDLLGEKKVPSEAYYGVQTQRAIENFQISNHKLSTERTFIQALGMIKKAAAMANHQIKPWDTQKYQAVIKACDEVIAGIYDAEFPIDLMQGGAGTSVNMNANEVIANRALEILGKSKGDYQFCSPNDDVNLAQSTNDVYPSALKLAVYIQNKELEKALEQLSNSFAKKAKEFQSVIKMGRTQLQDAVPMTLGQEFQAFANGLLKEKKNIAQAAEQLLELNIGATAIGTGINTAPDYAEKAMKHLSEISGLKVVLSEDLIEATSSTSAFVGYSSAMKQLATRLSKISNDLRLLSSGPRNGLNEINLPAKQPGSSIMPGKVNPVIPEVVNQVCFKVFGNDTTITFAAEAGQLQLNVMEPVIAQCLFESMSFLSKACETLQYECVEGITANVEHLKKEVENSIGIVTALNPYIGYKNATKIAKEALETNASVYDLVIAHGLLTKEALDEVLNPMNMLKS